MDNPDNLTSGRLLARNTLINLVSEVVPFLVAIFAIPALIGGIGVDRYGVLTLSMMVVGYFGLFDFGLGRAATKFIAEAAAARRPQSIPALFWTSLYMMLIFGAIAAALVAALAPWLVRAVLKIPPALHPESMRAFYLLALSMPFAISGGSLYGTLSAFQRFDLINAVRVPTGVFSYLGPLLVLPFSHSVAAMVAAMVLVRAAGWLAALLLCLRMLPALRHRMRPHRAVVRPMLSFGGWVTISAVVAPVMVYFDRFLIGAMLSMAAVSYYTVPFQVTSKLAILPGAMSGVIFAAFSGSFVRDPERAAVIFERASRYVLLAVFPPVLLISTFAPEGLSLWLGPSFAAHSTAVLRWLALGMFAGALAWIPLELIQAAHRPDFSAKVNLVEVPCYVAALLWMLPRYGIEGAAIVYTARVVAEAAALFIMARRLMPLAAAAVKRLAMLAGAAVAVMAAATMPMDFVSKCSFTTVILIAFAAVAWTFLLQPEEKVLLIRGSIRPSRVLALARSE